MWIPSYIIVTVNSNLECLSVILIILVLIGIGTHIIRRQKIRQYIFEYMVSSTTDSAMQSELYYIHLHVLIAFTHH